MGMFEDALKEAYVLSGHIWYSDEIPPEKNYKENEIKRLIEKYPVLVVAEELFDACQDAFNHAINDPVGRLDQIQLKKLSNALIKAKGKV